MTKVNDRVKFMDGHSGTLYIIENTYYCIKFERIISGKAFILKKMSAPIMDTCVTFMSSTQGKEKNEGPTP